MYLIDGQLTGLAGVLMNRMVDPSVLDTGISGAGGTKQDRLAEARLKVYALDDGTLCVPAWTLKRVLMDGARETKLKVAKTPLHKLIAAAVFIEGEPSFGVKAPDRIHEAVGKIPPRTGKAAIIRRPMLEAGWKLTFRLQVLDEFAPITPEQLKAAFAMAGVRVGLGSWRPEYGRFMVAEWARNEAA